jgi:hypothetical protein
MRTSENSLYPTFVNKGAKGGHGQEVVREYT